MNKNNKTLFVVESMFTVLLSSFISMYATVVGAESAGHGGGSWGWGFLLAVPSGFILGFIISGLTLNALKWKKSSHLFR